MKSVKFGDKDSLKDWGLILKPKSRPLPLPKTNFISIEGKDGDLDLTTALTGDVKYNNVSYPLEFTMLDKRENWETKLNEISTYLQGKKMKVIFSDDPEWYYTGRMTLDGISNSKNIGTIKIDCNFEPYRLKVTETIITEPIEAGKVITLPNSRKWVMPIVEAVSKNLFNINNVEWVKSYHGVNPIITIIDNNNFTMQNDVVDDWQGICIEGLDNESSYTISFDVVLTAYENNERAVTVNANKSGDNLTRLTQDETTHLTYTFSNTEKIYIRQSPKTTMSFSNVQVEEGSTETPFEVYLENPSANFTFEEKEFVLNGTLKTPEIILKEGGSEITLNSGEGNIRVSYREGSL